MMVQFFYPVQSPSISLHPTPPLSPLDSPSAEISASSLMSRRRAFSVTLSAISSSLSILFCSSPALSKSAVSEFVELPDSGGVRALDLRIGYGEVPVDGDRVAVHYYGRLAAKQGWRFDTTYDHKDENGEPIPFSFTLGSGKVPSNKIRTLNLMFYLKFAVISGLEASIRSMKVGGTRRVIIPPSQGYQNTSQEPIPPNFFDRQRLFTTIFNPTRLANGEGSSLGTLVFDIELLGLRHP